MSYKPPKLRVEDVLTLVVLSAMLLFAHNRSVLLHASLDESRWWELNFIYFPAALLVFIASWRYAFGTESHLNATLTKALTVIRDWMPFGLFLFVYEAFRAQLWSFLLGPDRDAALLAIDRAMMGETPAITLQWMITPWLTKVLVFAYFLHLVLPPVLALSLYGRDLLTFRWFLLSVFLAGVIGTIGYASVPAVGPGAAFPQLFRVTLAGMRNDPLIAIMDMARAPRDVFPSLHVGVSTIVLWFAWKYDRRWFWPMVPFVIANWFATLYLRYHYFIDVIAGFVCTALAIALSWALLQIERRLSAAGRTGLDGRQAVV